MEQSFPRKLRVRRKGEFEAVYQAQNYAGDAHLILNGRYRRETPSSARLGLSIGRRFGNAPQRNYWKRIIREAFRLEQPNLPVGWDLIVRPRGTILPSLAQARHSLVQLASRLAKRYQPTERS